MMLGFGVEAFGMGTVALIGNAVSLGRDRPTHPAWLAMGYIGLPRYLAEWIASLGLSQAGLLVVLVAFYIVLGCFLDGISMVVLTMGVILPTVEAAKIDLLWFGIFIVVVVEMAQITPPVGFNLFVLQGMTQRDIAWIAKACLPYFLLMVLAVVLLYAFPGLVTWLPSKDRKSVV